MPYSPTVTEKVHSIKDLGVVIENNVKFDEHVQTKVIKDSRPGDGFTERFIPQMPSYIEFISTIYIFTNPLSNLIWVMSYPFGPK